jgi:predicted outer membrane repeat protein
MSVALADDVVIQNNYASARGGGVYAQGPLTLSLSGDAAIADNVAGRGGGVTVVHAVSFNISGRVVVRGNSAVEEGDGGGLHMSCGCDGWVGGAARFEANEASPYNNGYGGAIFSDFSSLRVGGGAAFDSNRAVDGAGGAIYVQSTVLTEVEDDALFVGNRARTGGAICSLVSAPAVRLTGRARFEGNSAKSGGAVAVQRANLDISGRVLFLRNRGNSDGAVIAMKGVVTIAGEAAFLGNAATVDDGGAISIATSSSITIGGDVEISGNSAASSSGGALSLLSSTARFSGRVRVHNNTALYGGAVHVRYSRAGLR